MAPQGREGLTVVTTAVHSHRYMSRVRKYILAAAPEVCHAPLALNQPRMTGHLSGLANLPSFTKLTILHPALLRTGGRPLSQVPGRSRRAGMERAELLGHSDVKSTIDVRSRLDPPRRQVTSPPDGRLPEPTDSLRQSVRQSATHRVVRRFGCYSHNTRVTGNQS